MKPIPDMISIQGAREHPVYAQLHIVIYKRNPISTQYYFAKKSPLTHRGAYIYIIITRHPAG